MCTYIRYNDDDNNSTSRNTKLDKKKIKRKGKIKLTTSNENTFTNLY